MDFDAVVVGAGPAGALSARDMAAAGHRVLLLEDHAEIGEPLHCSGLVTGRTLEVAGVGPELVLNTINGSYLNHAAGKRVEIGGARPYAYVIDRVGFDRAIVGQAVCHGTEVTMRSRLIGIERVSGGLSLRVRRPEGESSITTRLLVGADGAQSLVARWMGNRPAKESLLGLSVEARIPSQRPDMVDVFVGQGVAPGFFGWMIPTGNGVSRIGVATHNGVKPVEHLQALTSKFPEVFADAEFGRMYGGLIPLTRNKKPFGENVLLVGDAAGQVKPTSGGGIYAGLMGARYGARIATQGLEQGDLSSSFLSAYGAAWDHDFEREFGVMKLLRRAFLSLSDSQMRRLLDLIERPSLLATLNRYGDIDFPSTLLGRLLGGPARPLAARALSKSF